MGEWVPDWPLGNVPEGARSARPAVGVKALEGHTPGSRRYLLLGISGPEWRGPSLKIRVAENKHLCHP